MIDTQFKIAVHTACLDLLKSKFSSRQSEMTLLQNDANEETKSSAGDKYETGRAMVMLEKEKVVSQMAETEKMLRIFQSIDPEKKADIAESGSLIRTDGGTFYLSAGLGKITVDGNDLFAISLMSPIGQAAIGKYEGESIQFNGRTLNIQSIC